MKLWLVLRHTWLWRSLLISHRYLLWREVKLLWKGRPLTVAEVKLLWDDWPTGG